jgi:hypothetical protein
MRTHSSVLRPALALGLMGLALAPAARAYWPGSPDPLPYVEVAGTSAEEMWPCVVPDGGGMLVFWGTTYGQQLFVKRLTATGAVDPAWPAAGLLVTDHLVSPSSMSVASDGAGGALVVWMDTRSGTNTDVYAHHVRAGGTLDPAWPAIGVAVCTAGGLRGDLHLVADTQGGAIAVWADTRSGNQDLYAQRVKSTGVVDPAWPANGRAICTATGPQSYPQAIPDGAGGAIVSWQDFRTSPQLAYVQHVRVTGVIDPAWPADGRAVTGGTNNQDLPVLAPDGDGGAIVAYGELHSGTSDVYAQHVLASGAVDPTWPAAGRALCSAANNQQDVRIVSDGAGGAIVGWLDHRGSPSMESVVYAQHVLVGGTVDPGWTVNGVSLHGSGIYVQTQFALMADGLGGAIASWAEGSASGYDVWAHRVTPAGTVDGMWGASGLAVASGSGDQYLPASTGDGQGGLLIAWTHTGSGVSGDIRARRVDRYGQFSAEPRIDWIQDVWGDNGGAVYLRFHTSPLEDGVDPSFYYRVWRQVPQAAAAASLARGARVVADPVAPGACAPGTLLARPDGASTSYWEYVQYVYGYGIYSILDATLATPCDSVVGGSNPLTTFMVEGVWPVTGNPHWFSEPLAGYSIDDTAPLPPYQAVATYAAGVTTLHWAPSSSPDRARYRVYRNRDSAYFYPAPEWLIGETADTTFTDPLGIPCYYALRTVDIHGNEGDWTHVSANGPADVASALPHELALSAPVPNPLRSASALRLALPAAAHVKASVYDAQGRRVRELLDTALPAGEHLVRFDGRDENGAALASGLYLFRFETGARVLSRRLVVVR